MTMSVRRLSTAAGAEIRGIDLTKPLDAGLVDQLHKALGEYCVLLFRGAKLTPDQHIAFSRHFGPLEQSVVNDVFGLPGHPEILMLSNVTEDGKPKGAKYAGQFWHSDTSFMEKPPVGSLLLCHEMPEVGGDTMFANMYLAYETLSATLKSFLGQLKAVHDYSKNQRTHFSKFKDRPPATTEHLAKTPPVEHPVVRTHPVTGRKALYVSPAYVTGIAGMPDEESEPLLQFLYRHSTRAEFIYRHKWQVHDLMFWDNRCAMHHALADYDDSVRRQMHRVTVLSGDRPC